MKDAFDIRNFNLPAAEIADEVNRRLAESPRLVITAPPGAGKSTLLPLAMLDGPGGGGRIIMLEPRRLAARQIACRMAEMLGEQAGETVGYRMRLDTKVSGKTRIEVVTEGVLTRMLVNDPGLEGISAVIFDEFHERSLTADVALALSRQAQDLLRPDLRIVIMSATMDTEWLCRELDAPLVESGGKMFPVEVVHYCEEADAVNVAEVTARAVRMAHGKHDGDILAFLPGEGEIRRCAEMLGHGLGNTRVYPLYGMLTLEEQRLAIAPSKSGERKIVLATPIAETSLTIEGVRIVVDSGLCRRQVFEVRSCMTRLETVRISMDMADQRAGRAGRLAPGVCYRLWSLGAEKNMAPARVPEIMNADLAGTMLDIAAWGEKMESIPWMTLPAPDNIDRARRLLESLGAIDSIGRITAHGRELSELPCHPRIGQMLLKAETQSDKALAADVAALLEERDPMGHIQETGIDIRISELRKNRLKVQGGIWGRISKSSMQYCRITGAVQDNSVADPYKIGELLAAAYPERIGRAWKDGRGRFQFPDGSIAAMDETDMMSSCEWLVACSLNLRKDGVGRIFLAAPLSEEDAGAMAEIRDRIFWDSRQGCVTAQRETRLGAILLGSSVLHDVPKEKIINVICEAAKKEGRSMFDFSDKAENLVRRISAAAAWHPELDLPDVTADALLGRAGEWLPLYIGNARTAADLKKINMCDVIWAQLSYMMQQEVERLAPEYVTVPTGSRIRLEYRHGADAPVVRVRLQECFGLTDTPAVDGGRLPVLMELLSPGYKAVQLTSDLRSFWSGTYFEVRKELRRRYPKHSWPDNPLEAEAVRGVMRKKD
ncbi:MAG: ATP-dependent helicase HrpB [Bacteroidales bacterium]|nr:ATP-dependent helicase HrpB [Bacteroidales bacterium]